MLPKDNSSQENTHPSILSVKMYVWLTQEILDVLVKIYRPNKDIKYPNGGKFTPYLETLNEGDRIHLEGPFGNFDYLPGGNVVISKKTFTQRDRLKRSRG